MRLEYLLHVPQSCVAKDEDGHELVTADGMALLTEAKRYARSCEGDFGTLRSRMREYDAFWRREAVRWQSPEDKAFAEYLPVFPTNEGRVLCDKVVRAVSKKRATFHVALRAEWAEEKRTQSQAYEDYLTAVNWMADRERMRRRFGYVQPTLAWMLAVRGGAILIPFVRAGPKSPKAGDYGDGDDPFVWRTPDPAESVWSDGNDGLSFFAHGSMRSLYDYAHLGHMAPNPKHYEKGLCEVFNVWWSDAQGDVWNCVIVENCFAIPPTNHTKSRGLRRLPVIIDSAFGAPVEAHRPGSGTLDLDDHYQGVMENNREAYPVTNTINAYNMRLMRDSALWSVAFFGKNVTTDEAKDFFTGRTVVNLPADSKAPALLSPPQLSESLVRWSQTLDRYKQMGGMPDVGGAGVPEGMTGLAIQEVTLQGDLKAGPMSEAIKRMLLEAACLTTEMHRALGSRRRIKLSGYTTANQPYFGDMTGADLPGPYDYLLQVRHEPFLVKDGFRDAQEAATWAGMGRAFLAIMDIFADDPIREDQLRVEQLAKALPGVSYLDMAAQMQKLHPDRADITRFLMGMAAKELGQPQGGQANPPRPAAGPTGGPLPDEQGMAVLPPPSEAGLPIDPASEMGEALAGAIGGNRGGY